ncbi:hypothetical protein MJL48_32700, partial [Salmonella enterica subsp. enterica serovar Kentucky]|nr:hypothetical protein [Salmonella enterica subsp. enterica serovar Kentucky]
DVVPQTILLEAAVELAKKERLAQRTLPVRERILAGPLGRALLGFLAGTADNVRTPGARHRWPRSRTGKSLCPEAEQAFAPAWLI